MGLIQNEIFLAVKASVTISLDNKVDRVLQWFRAGNFFNAITRLTKYEKIIISHNGISINHAVENKTLSQITGTCEKFIDILKQSLF